MFSPSKAPRRPDALGSGGKAPRGSRWAAASASVSPYLRPEDSPPPPSSQTENPKWFSGIIFGAGRLLSSMFRSDDDESSCSYSSDTDGGRSVTSDEDENADASSEEFHELDECRGNSQIRTRHEDGPQSTTQRSERNLIIEQLLLQETFSRGECDRLIKIIRSRVVDTVDGGKAGVVKELPGNTACSVMTFLGAPRSLNPERRSAAGLTHVVNHLNDLSPRSIVPGLCSAELHGKVIMEAKKWLEKKKSASTSKSELDCGPCMLNTDAFHCLTEDEVGSPVDMAKSYMRTMSPWKSPILSSTGFKATSPTGTHPFEDEAPYAISDRSFFTSKAQKRSNHNTDFHEIRRMCLKSVVIRPEPTISQKIDSSVRMSEPEVHQTRSAASERDLAVACTDNYSSPSPSTEASKPVGTSASIPAELAAEDSCPQVILGLPDERTLKDLEESRPMKEQVKNVSLPDESASSEPSAVTYNDAIDFDEELLDAKPNALGSAGVKSLLLRDAGATKMRQDCGSSSLEILRQFEERDTPLASGALKQVENGTDIKSIKQMLADSSDSRHGRGRKIAAEPKRGFAAYGNFSFQPSSLKKSDCCFPESSNDGSAVAMPVESCKLSTDVSISPVDCATGGILKKPDHGSTMKSIKRMLAESLPDSRRGRGRKVAARYRRGRGSGK